MLDLRFSAVVMKNTIFWDITPGAISQKIVLFTIKDVSLEVDSEKTNFSPCL
jgi:hypothetical protein